MTKANSQPIKTWPWILAVIGLLIVLFMFSGPREWVIQTDIRVSYWMNGLLGHNETLDRMIGALNSRAGDRAMITLMLCILGAHAWRNTTRPKTRQRLAFWTWTILIFIILYQTQRMVEDAFTRDSPGKVLEPWNDLRDMYDISAKTTNTNSFPSGHASAYFFFAFMALRRYPKIGLILLGIASTVPLTRIMTGAHWPSDIYLGSIFYALLVSALAHETFLRRLYDRLDFFYGGLMFVFSTRGKRPVRVRLKSAWSEFIATESKIPEADAPPEEDKKNSGDNRPAP